MKGEQDSGVHVPIPQDPGTRDTSAQTSGADVAAAVEPAAAPPIQDVPAAVEPAAAPPIQDPGADVAAAVAPAMPPPIPPAVPPLVEVAELDWMRILEAVDPAALRARMHVTVERLEALLDSEGGPDLLFDADRSGPHDRAIRVACLPEDPVWVVGDLHGDLLALEAALACIQAHATQAGAAAPRIIFLGDFCDDEGLGLEVLLRVFELVIEAPQRICIVAGNHDEALGYDGARFTSTVAPSDFADQLNANLAHEWIVRVGKLAVRMAARAPRALFLPDGLLVAHGGFPLSDLHPALLERSDWNDPACLTDFVWSRAHPKARKKMPNRFSRGSQFGWQDFADFCAVSARLDRPVTHMVRGHDHVDDRWAVYPAYAAHPILTTIALSRRLPREQFGAHQRWPTIARLVPGCLPEVHRLQIPPEVVDQVFPPPPPLTVDDERAFNEAQGSAP